MAREALVYGSMHEGDLPAVARLLHLAFAGPLEASEAWVRPAGIEHMRARRAATARAGLAGDRRRGGRAGV